MTNPTKLLPCPFCGSSVIPSHEWAQCSNSACPAFHIKTSDFAAWNRRAAPAEDVRAVQDGTLIGEGTILQVAEPQQKRLLPSQAILPHPPRHEGFLQPEREVPGYTIEQMKEYGAQCVAAFIKQNPQ